MIIIKQVIVIRKDLNMRKGKMCAQAAHASLKVFFDRIFKIENASYSVYPDKIVGILMTQEMLSWVEGSFTKICVYVNSEEELFEIYKQAKESDLPVALIRDAGKTEFKEPTYTCLAIGPAKSELIDKITGELKLL